MSSGCQRATAKRWQRTRPSLGPSSLSSQTSLETPQSNSPSSQNSSRRRRGEREGGRTEGRGVQGKVERGRGNEDGERVGVRGVFEVSSEYVYTLNSHIEDRNRYSIVAMETKTT